MRLSLCMIVKDEEAFLDACLQGVRGLANELIVADTGSTDATKAIAKRHGAKVIDVAWTDDFSAARNASLREATGDWILVLDADEAIAPGDQTALRALLENAPAETHAFLFTQRSYLRTLGSTTQGTQGGLNLIMTGLEDQGFVLRGSDQYRESEGFAGWFPAPVVRLFRNGQGIAFRGAVHEDVAPSVRGGIVSAGIPIHHYGKLDKESLARKMRMYERLGEKKLDEEAGTARSAYAAFELGRQYLALNKFDEAFGMFERSAAADPGFWASWFNLGSLCLLRGRRDEAVQHLRRALELHPDGYAPHAALGTALLQHGDLSGAIERLERAVAIKPDDAASLKNLGVAHAKRGEHRKAAVRFLAACRLDPSDAAAHLNLGLSLNALGDRERAGLALRKAVSLNPEYGKRIKFH